MVHEATYVMKRATAAYFDGTVSTRRQVELFLENGTLFIRGDGVERTYPASSIAIPPAVGSVRRTVRLPDGGVCEIGDNGLLAELAKASGTPSPERLVHRWEKSLPLALGAVALTALVVALFLRFGVPVLARHAALALPAATEKTIGRETLATLDKIMMKPSTLEQKRRDELTALFRRVAGADATAAGCRLEFRSIPAVGANAFALPSGIVIVTDDLVELARSDDEIAAIMAHELGHVKGRHVMRHLLQSSAAGLIVATLTGDVVSITSLAATLPTVLVDASFSREFEREADDAAIAWMKGAGVSPRRYAEILARLQAQLNVRHAKTPGDDHPVRNYLSTHPDTGDRIRHIMSVGGN